jgi:hypothetical protein
MYQRLPKQSIAARTIAIVIDRKHDSHQQSDPMTIGRMPLATTNDNLHLPAFAAALPPDSRYLHDRSRTTMLGKLASFIRPASARSIPHSPLLPQIVRVLGNDIAEARAFEERTSIAIDYALSYFARQTAEIPGPLDLTEANFPASPQLAELFPEPCDVRRAFGRSLAVKSSLHPLCQAGHSEIHALLGLRIKPHGQTGNISEATPADHVLHSLGPDLESTRESLCRAAFERILKNFAEHVEKLRRRQRLSKLEWEWNLQHDIGRTVDTGHPEYVYAEQELTPEKLLNGFISWLEKPEVFFRVMTAHDGEAALSLQGAASIPALHCSDRRQWRICFIRFSADEAADALHSETHNHRYLFI